MSDLIGGLKGVGIPDAGSALKALREDRGAHMKDGRILAAHPAPSDSALPAEVPPSPEVSPQGSSSTYRVGSNEEGRPVREEGLVSPNGQPPWQLTPPEERELRSLRRQEAEGRDREPDSDSDDS